MMKTYTASLLCIFLAGAQFAQAQESMDSILADLDYVESGPTAVESSAPEANGSDAAAETAAAPVAKKETLADRGIALYDAGEYAQAKIVFDSILEENPFDKTATSYLKRIAQRVSLLEGRKQATTREEAMTVIEGAWNEDTSVIVKIEEPKDETEIDPEELAIAEKTKQIKEFMIPTIDFMDANVKDVSLYLSEACRRVDPEGKGINILLIGTDGSYDMNANTVTISIRDMSLYDVLNYVAEMAKLRFEVRPNAVVMMPINYVRVTELVTKMYTVSPDVGSDLEAAGGDGGGGGGDDLFGSSFSVAAPTGPVSVVDFFSTVSFPEGSSADYHPSDHQLIVKNTAENFKELERILDMKEMAAARKRSQQVEIEAKFVEFAEGAQKELGFDWNVYGTGSVGGFTMKDGTFYQSAVGLVRPETPANYQPNTGFYAGAARGYQQVQGGQNLLGNAMRTGANVYEAVQSGVTSSMGGIPSMMVFENGDVDVTIRALEQEGTADVLSAPRVTTKSGNEALIRVVEVHRYPQDYDVETGQRTAPVVKPQDWEDFDLGVVLKVTPVVDTESNTIDLDLQPEITKFRGFDEYTVAYNAYIGAGGEYDDDGGNYVGDGSALKARMPFFEKRVVMTQVTIADGHTVVMGGLVDERTETFRDQVPFLGDIPYIGRLFRTEGSRNAKKNLTIFVRATQVDDRGMTQKQREMASGVIGQ